MQQELTTVNSMNTGDELGMEIRRLRDEQQALQNEQASRQIHASIGLVNTWKEPSKPMLKLFGIDDV